MSQKTIIDVSYLMCGVCVCVFTVFNNNSAWKIILGNEESE